MTQVIAVLDFGSQYTQVIARRIRECGVYSRIYPYETKTSQLKKDNVEGIILSGGPSSVFSRNAPMPDKKIFQIGIPVLGICYGIQLMGALLGGKVERSEQREYGHGILKIKKRGMLLRGLSDQIRVWNSHGDKMERLPSGFQPLASTENSTFAVIEDKERYLYGLQFHPEVYHTEQGIKIIRNFLYNICHCSGDWSMADYINKMTREIRETVGNERVILGLSGGVDSSVAAVLIHQAIGDQLTCVFVDNGLLRINEGENVERIFNENFQSNLRIIRSSNRFLKRLKGVINPESKRRIIGKVFIEVFEETVKSIGDVTFLAQGTLYPDVIESVPIDGNPAALIKTHHNVGGLPKRMKLKLLEPLRELFKDEVRELGEELGLPRELVWRQPFPGPGLGVRVIGEISRPRLNILRRSDAILTEEMFKSGYYYKVWQSFAVFLPVRTVGVMGDERTYENVIALRIVNSMDAMTADWTRLPHKLIQKISTRIINEVEGVNRVVLDVSSKPPSTIEWE